MMRLDPVRCAIAATCAGMMLYARALADPTPLSQSDPLSQSELTAKYQTPDSKFLELDGIHIHYYDQGQGPVIVLIHGEMDSLRSWDEVAPLLTARFRVVRLDVPDNGLSGPDPRRHYSFEGYAETLGRFVDRLGIDRFAVAGSSWGDSIAYTYAIRHPDRVAAEILISIPGVRDAKKSFLWALTHMSAVRQPGGLPEATPDLLCQPRW